jgi:hypothetical protein
MWFLTAQNQKFPWLNSLSVDLLRMSGFITCILGLSDDRGADNTEFTRRELTDYVLGATGKPHDAQVADLIRVTLRGDAAPNGTATQRRSSGSIGHGKARPDAIEPKVDLFLPRGGSS